MLARAIPRSTRRASHHHTTCEHLAARWPFWLARTLPRPFPPAPSTAPPARHASSSSSSTRWLTRSRTDTRTQEAKLNGLKSRAAFKLLEIDAKYKLIRPGDTVVDLGYAPGSWSQVAVSKVRARDGGDGGGKRGRVVGIDVLPVQPPRGVSTLQGDFLSGGIREEVRRFVAEGARGRVGAGEEEEGRSVVDRAGREAETEAVEEDREAKKGKKAPTQKELDVEAGRVVDVVLSDMCEPWPLVAATWVRSVSNPYRRMMNTSGMAFRDHAGSMVRELLPLFTPPLSLPLTPHPHCITISLPACLPDCLTDHMYSRTSATQP